MYVYFFILLNMKLNDVFFEYFNIFCYIKVFIKISFVVISWCWEFIVVDIYIVVVILIGVNCVGVESKYEENGEGVLSFVYSLFD